MSICVQSLRERSVPDDARVVERDLIELEGAIDSAFHIARELIGEQAPATELPAVADINELTLDLSHVLARVLGRGIRLILRLDASDAMVEAEAVQLEWLLLNLAANSRDAMPEGGVFEIRTASVTRHLDPPPRDVRYIHVTVTDTGHGFSEDVRQIAFEPFVSTREGHTGFGLTSVAMIVRRVGGSLYIESDHTGTRVHIHLPVLVPAGR
jgi:signal transduction histidine kinase